MRGCTSDWRKLSLSLLCVDSVLLALQRSCWVTAWSHYSTACWCVDRHVNDLLGWLTLETLTPSYTHWRAAGVEDAAALFHVCLFLLLFFLFPHTKRFGLKMPCGVPFECVLFRESVRVFTLALFWLLIAIMKTCARAVLTSLWKSLYVDLTEPMKRSVRQVSFVAPPHPPPPPPCASNNLPALVHVYTLLRHPYLYIVLMLFLFYVGLMSTCLFCQDVTFFLFF